MTSAYRTSLCDGKQVHVWAFLGGTAASQCQQGPRPLPTLCAQVHFQGNLMVQNNQRASCHHICIPEQERKSHEWAKWAHYPTELSHEEICPELPPHCERSHQLTLVRKAGQCTWPLPRKNRALGLNQGEGKL